MHAILEQEVSNQYSTKIVDCLFLKFGIPIEWREPKKWTYSNLISVRQPILFSEETSAPIFSTLPILSENDVEMLSDKHDESDFEEDST